MITGLVAACRRDTAAPTPSYQPPPVAAAPTDASAAPAVTAVTGGEPFCTLHADGSVRCWMGDGRNPHPELVPVTGRTTAIDAAFYYGVCGVHADGHVYCANTWKDKAPLVPRDVCGITDATALDVGPEAACAIEKGGRVECWGRNAAWFAPCDASGARAPVEVPGVSGAVSLSVGAGDACAVLGDGHVTCWRVSGDLAAPVVATPIKGLTKATAVLSQLQTCAIVDSGGVCCMDVGSARDRIALPVPTLQLASHGSGFCALGNDHVARCWTANDPIAPAEDFPGDLMSIAGDGSALCAITRAGDVLCEPSRRTGTNDGPRKIQF